MTVRLVWRSKRRVPKTGIVPSSTRPSSMICPVFTSCIAASTVAGFTWLAEPRVSPAPHLDGHRCASLGGFQPWAATGAAAATSIRIGATSVRMDMAGSSLQ